MQLPDSAASGQELDDREREADSTSDEGAIPQPTPELLAKAQDLLSNVELLDVRPSSISARIEDGIAPGTHVASIEMNFSVAFAADEGIYGNRIDYSFGLVTDDEQTIGHIEFSLLLDYDVRGGFRPDEEAADYVAATTGWFAAYPYARELFQSLITRLQFDPIVLGLIKRGTMKPGAISVVPRRQPGS